MWDDVHDPLYLHKPWLCGAYGCSSGSTHRFVALRYVLQYGYWPALARGGEKVQHFHKDVSRLQVSNCLLADGNQAGRKLRSATNRLTSLRRNLRLLFSLLIPDMGE